MSNFKKIAIAYLLANGVLALISSGIFNLAISLIIGATVLLCGYKKLRVQTESK